MNQGTQWTDVRRAVIRADELRIDSLWTWDHLLPVDAPLDQPVLESWALMAAWAAITRYPTLGLMVGANTLRHPALVAKGAVTVDHISNGRCIVGIGAGSSALEHHLHGIPSGATLGQRFSWLEEAIGTIRSLMAGREVTSGPGSHYGFAGVKHFPHPVKGPGQLRILVGGSGARKTLPIVAKLADLWNPGAPTTEFNYVRERSAMLDELCLHIGRDPAEIERTLDPIIMIRADRHDAEQAFNELVAAHTTTAPTSSAWLGPPRAIADAFRPYVEIGFSHLIAGLPAPYDTPTIEGMAEVRDLLDTHA